MKNELSRYQQSTNIHVDNIYFVGIDECVKNNAKKCILPGTHVGGAADHWPVFVQVTEEGPCKV